jgi:bifunctional UDP-N-acetylglucosamine pyrophosphorylase/glucosamine-1-phosphate N-acetyltransferase
MPRKKPKATGKELHGAPLSIVVLAAGQGKRMLSDLPKVLQPLAGMPLLAHVLDLAASLTPAAIHIVYGHGGERVRELFSGQQRQWSLQSQQLGTGHAVGQAMPGIPDPHRVLVLYGDVPLLHRESLQRLLAASRTAALGLLTARLANPSGYGRIVRNRRGAPVRIVEESDAGAEERRIQEVNTGVVTAKARLLRSWLQSLKPRNVQGEYYLTDVLAQAVKDKCTIATVEATDATEVLGVNDRLQLADAEAEYRRRRARALMAQGVTLIDPARIDIRGPVTVGRDVELDVNVVLEGPLVLGDGVRIGPNCVVSNTLIGAGTVVHANSVLQDAQIGRNCRIGPFCRVRPETRVADEAHLGNFVEIKASRIGVGSKINHLTYVGDSEVGSAVNIGAGTVTCNYDGANKWTTRIGDRAFIGSGSMLVAPVMIGEGATIGAGSTISKDAPADKLTVARSRQRTVEDWQRPRKSSKRP